MDSLQAHPTQSHLIITSTNSETQKLNNAARQELRRRGLLETKEVILTVERPFLTEFGDFATETRQRAFAVGETIVFLKNKNDPQLTVKSGTRARLHQVGRHRIKAWLLEEKRMISFSPKLYPLL